MYICNCGKGHKLTEEQYNMVDGEQELRLQHECGFDIIIGGDKQFEIADDGNEVINMYSFDTKEITEDEERIAKTKSIAAEIVSIRMKCGHDANWRSGHGNIYCHKECAWDENGKRKDLKAWEQDHEYMYPELKS